MRPSKLYGPVAMTAVLFALALIGPSTAAAGQTALCEKSEAPCAAANIYTGHFEAVAENPTFLTTSGDITCDQSVLLGNALGLGSPLLIHLELLTFSGDCLLNESTTECEVVATGLGLLLLLRTVANLGFVQSHAKVLVNCPNASLHCPYGGLPLFHAEGSPNGAALAAITADEVLLEHGESLFCPEETKFDAEYEVQLPDPIVISG